MTTESLLVYLNGDEKSAQEIINQSNNFAGVEKTSLGTVRIQKFSDNEVCIDFLSSVRGKRVYILSSPNSSDEIMKLNLAIDAAKRGAASEIIPILPYFPYARQDKKDQSRGPIGAKVVAEMLEQRGSTSVITFDLHADQIQGFFNIPVTHIEGKNVFDDYIATNLIGGATVLCGPDAGSGKRVKRMQKQIQSHYNVNLNYVMMDKTRTEANKVDEMVIIGDVKGKNVIILDDLIDTAGTLCMAASVLKNAGAIEVNAVISHGVLSGPALERIGKSDLNSLIISNSLPIDTDTKLPKQSAFVSRNDSDKYNAAKDGLKKILVISVASQIGFAMAAINNHMSYEALKAKHEEEQK